MECPGSAVESGDKWGTPFGGYIGVLNLWKLPIQVCFELNLGVSRIFKGRQSYWIAILGASCGVPHIIL